MAFGGGSKAGMNPANKPKREGLDSGPAKSLAPTSGSDTEKFMKMRNEKRRNNPGLGVKS